MQPIFLVPNRDVRKKLVATGKISTPKVKHRPKEKIKSTLLGIKFYIDYTHKQPGSRWKYDAISDHTPEVLLPTATERIFSQLIFIWRSLFDNIPKLFQT